MIILIIIASNFIGDFLIFASEKHLVFIELRVSFFCPIWSPFYRVSFDEIKRLKKENKYGILKCFRLNNSIRTTKKLENMDVNLDRNRKKTQPSPSIRRWSNYEILNVSFDKEAFLLEFIATTLGRFGGKTSIWRKFEKPLARIAAMINENLS